MQAAIRVKWCANASIVLTEWLQNLAVHTCSRSYSFTGVPSDASTHKPPRSICTCASGGAFPVGLRKPSCARNNILYCVLYLHR